MSEQAARAVRCTSAGVAVDCALAGHIPARALASVPGDSRRPAAAPATTARPRVLVLTSTFPRWSGDTEPPFVFELSRRLAERFEVIVLAPHAARTADRETLDGIAVNRFRYAPVAWERLAYEGGVLANLRRSRANWLLVLPFVVAQWIAAVRLLRRARFDAIHAHWIVPQGVIALAARFVSGSKARILCTSHGGDLYGLRGALLAALKRRVIRSVERMTVVSEAMRSAATAVAGRADVDVVSMGVDCRSRFTPCAGQARNPDELLFVGRLVEKKGLIHLIEALPEIARMRPQVRLKVAGSGPEESALRARAGELGVAARIDFLGPVANDALPELYRRASLFVAPGVVARDGDQEGLGLVYVEALACECPVVASDLPAIRDVVVDGVNGVMVPPGDSRALAASVTTLLADRTRCMEMGRAGRSMALERFDWTVIARRYGDLLGGAA